MQRLQAQLCAALTAHQKGGKARPPEAGIQLWNAFQHISATRTYNAVGPNPISYCEIEAWARLSRTPLAPQHVQILIAMDGAWLEQAYARNKIPEGTKALPPVSAQPLTAALFDIATVGEA